MKKFTALAIMLMLMAVIGCQQGADTQAPVEKPVDIAAIKAQLAVEQQAYAQAWCDKDMNAISEIWSHDPDITIFDAGERPRIEGWEGPNGVKALYQNAFNSLKSIDFKISDLKVDVTETGTAAVITYYVQNDIVDQDGNPGQFTPRVTVARELIDGKWKTIHGYASLSIAGVKALK